MIMTVPELRQFIQSDESDQALEAKLSALELLIRSYTNNNFQMRSFRSIALAQSNEIIVSGTVPFRVGDTLQITESDLNPDKLITIIDITGNTLTINEFVYDEGGIVVTKVNYPADIKMGVVNLMKWEANNRDKVGVASETISRHSVTYFNQDGDNTVMGYPKTLMGFLKPYMKARFGRGIRV